MVLVLKGDDNDHAVTVNGKTYRTVNGDGVHATCRRREKTTTTLKTTTYGNVPRFYLEQQRDEMFRKWYHRDHPNSGHLTPKSDATRSSAYNVKSR